MTSTALSLIKGVFDCIPFVFTLFMLLESLLIECFLFFLLSSSFVLPLLSLHHASFHSLLLPFFLHRFHRPLPYAQLPFNEYLPISPSLSHLCFPFLSVSFLFHFYTFNSLLFSALDLRFFISSDVLSFFLPLSLCTFLFPSSFLHLLISRLCSFSDIFMPSPVIIFFISSSVSSFP